MHSRFDTSLAAIDAGGLQATSRVGPAAAAVRSNSALSGALSVLCSYWCLFPICFCTSPYIHFKLRILNKDLINFSIFDSCIAAGLDSLFSFLFVSSAARFVVFAVPILSGLLCREDARSGVCHIRCVRMPIGYQPPTTAIPTNQLSASWPFHCCPDPDGRWSMWLVAVSTGTAGWGGGGGGKGPGLRARDFLG